MHHFDFILLLDWNLLFEKRIINTVLTLVVGGLLFKWISDKRAKRDKIREKSIEFLDEISLDLNSAISLLFESIRKEQFLTEHPNLKTLRRKLFTKRFTVRIKGEALLKDPEFSEKYDLLIWEINDLVDLMFLPNNTDKNQLSAFISERIVNLENNWEIKSHPKETEELIPVFQKMAVWNEQIYERAINLLTSNMNKLK